MNETYDAMPIPFWQGNFNHGIDGGSFSRLREINQNSSFSTLG